MNQTIQRPVDTNDKKTLNLTTKKSVELEKSNNKELQKVALMSYISS